MARQPKKGPPAKSRRLWLKMFVVGGFSGLLAVVFYFTLLIGRNYLQEGSLGRATRTALRSMEESATQAVTRAVMGERTASPAAGVTGTKGQPRQPAEMSRQELEAEVKRLNEELLTKDRENAELTIQLRLLRDGSKTE